MKKWMTVIFATMIAIALSAPAWAQTTPTTPAHPTTVSKAQKKQAKAKAKAEKKAAKKNAVKNNNKK
jgi:hypothetical protein